MSSDIRMVDIGAKKDVERIAVARGSIRLRPETIKAILEGRVPKGNVFAVARLAAILAVKKTWDIVPLCHPIPITSIDVSITPSEERINVEVKVKTVAKTGVEMEALTGVSAALLAVWDMVKALEKDERGQYPFTCIEKIEVVSKVKREI